MKNPLKERRTKRKETQLLRELSNLLVRIALDEAQLSRLSITRVQLSSDKSRCTVFFHDPEGPEKFKELFHTLILYKPSLRKALSQAISARYTPELVFKYDDLYDKQRRIDTLISQIMTNGSDTDTE